MTKQEFLAMSLPIYNNKEIAELEGEVFKIYKDNPFYMVSNFGRVKSIDKEVNHNYGGKCIKKSKILTQTDNGSGYLSVGLTSKGGTKTTRVSRMVATTFVLNPENKPQVNHINGDKKDNRAENLEWTTFGENVRHAWNNQLAKKRTLFLQIQSRLKRINPYITEGVRIITPKGTGVIIIDQNCYRIQYDNGKLENLVKSVRFWGKDFKLCLRSLSDLTKEIEHKGEVFVPIVELAKIAEGSDIKILDYKQKQSAFGVRYIDRLGDKRVFAYHKETSTFAINSFDYDFFDICMYQLQLFQQLLKWHFDLFGGIESGEAIDVNTLDINPYK